MAFDLMTVMHHLIHFRTVERALKTRLMPLLRLSSQKMKEDDVEHRSLVQNPMGRIYAL